MKILFLHNYESPYRNKLFCDLAKKGVTITIAYLQDSSSDSRSWDFFREERPYEVYSIPFRYIGKMAINPLHDLLKLARRHDKVVVLNNIPNAVTCFFISILVPSKKLILWAEEHTQRNPFIPLPKAAFFGCLTKFLWLRCSTIFSFSERTYKYFKKFGKRVFKIVQSAERMNDVESVNRKKHDGTVFGYIGQIKPVKNLELLLETFVGMKVREKGSNKRRKLIVAGDGILLRDFKERYIDESISFLGNVAGERKDDFFNSIDFLVLPSHYDCWGLVINEAMIRGIPCIVSSSVGAEEMVRTSGWLFQTESSSSLEKVLTLASQISPFEYERRSSEARQMAKEFVIEKSVDALVDALRERDLK